MQLFVFSASSCSHKEELILPNNTQSLDMVELNNNEKYCDLPNSLPTNSSKSQTIKSGDLMLYGSKTLVLFYKSFSTPYSYTQLGAIDDVTGLEEALGTGSVIVKFETE